MSIWRTNDAWFCSLWKTQITGNDDGIFKWLLAFFLQFSASFTSLHEGREGLSLQRVTTERALDRDRIQMLLRRKPSDVRGERRLKIFMNDLWTSQLRKLLKVNLSLFTADVGLVRLLWWQHNYGMSVNKSLCDWELSIGDKKRRTERSTMKGFPSPSDQESQIRCRDALEA